MRRLGIGYYPELYDENVRERFLKEDIEQMKAMHFSVVRMAEFTWCLMEPSEGVYELDWLEHTVNELGKNGILTVLCTPTAAPPIWMAEKYPDICLIDNYRQQRPYGGRHFKCNMNPTVVEKTQAICAELGRRFGHNPYVLGFQVDNELAQEGSGRCQCPSCRKRFREWLKERYGDIDTLNRCWKTLFWGQTYPSFEAVLPPAHGRYPQGTDTHGWLGADNPSLRLDFERFSSDSLAAYYELQRSAILPYTDKPVTHNTTCLGVCQADWGRMLRNSPVAGVDFYPSGRAQNQDIASFTYSHARNILGRDFWLLETTTGGGHGNWAKEGRAQPFPGALRQNLLYAYASGAEIITAFKYMIFAGGFEQLGNALLDLDRVPRRRCEEFRMAGEDLARLSPLLDRTRLEARVAVVFNFDSLWSNGIKPIDRSLRYQDYLKELYFSLIRLGINVDVIDDTRALDGYSLVILPLGCVMPPSFEEKVRRYAENGGTVLATCLSFSKDANGNGVIGQAIPVNMEDFFGMRVAEVEGVHDDEQNISLLDLGGITVHSRNWQEVLELTCGAESAGRYADTFRAGETVYTAHRFGRGRALYLGALLPREDMTRFAAGLLTECGVQRAPVDLTNPSLDAVTRTDGETEYYFLFNSSVEAVSAPLSAPVRDAEGGECFADTVSVPGKGLRVLVRA